MEIDGPGCPTIKDTTIAAVCGRRFSANETMGMVGTYFDQGDEATSEGKFDLAVAKYKAALITISGNPFDAYENDELLIGGRFTGLQAGW